MNTNKTIVIIGLICLLMMIVTTTEARGETLNGTNFSLDIPDNWSYNWVFGKDVEVKATPPEFSALLINDTNIEEINEGGAYAGFERVWYYPIHNSPFDTFIKYQIDKNLSHFYCIL